MSVQPVRLPRVNLSTNTKWSLGFVAFAIALMVFYYIDTYFRGDVAPGVHTFMNEYIRLDKLVEAMVYVMCALGLNIVVGYAGLLDLGYVAFWAIGGYTAGWLMSDQFPDLHIKFLTTAQVNRLDTPGIHINFWIVLVAAALLCALFGLIIGAPTLRLKSDYLALVTLGFGEIIPQFFYNGRDIAGFNLTNGTQGINPVDTVRFLAFDSSGKVTWKDLGPFDLISKFFILCLLTAVIIFVSLRLRDGKLGRAWLAIREDELAASAMGVPLMRTKLASYAIGAISGGFGGVAFALYVEAALPDRFKFDISITLLSMVVLGGMGNVWGVTVGALLLALFNSTWLPLAQRNLFDSTANGHSSGIAFLVVGAAVIAAGIGLWITPAMRRRVIGVLLVYVGVPIATIGVTSLVARQTSYEFLVFGSVLIIMMLFRREGLIPEARTRLVLREPERGAAESLSGEESELDSVPVSVLQAGEREAAQTAHHIEGEDR